jgi:hypothetical protein
MGRRDAYWLGEEICVVRQPSGRVFKIGACFGVAVAALVLAYGYLEPHISGPRINDWFVFFACPPSIALMATDSGNWVDYVFADLVVVVANAAWYGVLFAGATMLFRRSSKARTCTPDS